MKHWLLVVALVCFGSIARAQTAPASADQSFGQLLTDKVKETRPVVLISPVVKPAYSAFLPIWTFHAAYDKDMTGKDIIDHYRDTVELGIGGKYETGNKATGAFLGGGINIIALSSRLWDFAWAKSHVRRSAFPCIFLRPAVTMPIEFKEYRQSNVGEFFKNNSRLMASVIIKL